MAPAVSTKPATSAAASASNGALAAPTPVGYAMPPPSALHVIQPVAAPPSSAPVSAPSVRVIAPARGTLAAGKYEASPSTIWILVAVGALLSLGWTLYRVRRSANERRRKLEAMTRVAGRHAPSTLTPRS